MVYKSDHARSDDYGTVLPSREMGLREKKPE
jgi:hypothetical protein